MEAENNPEIALDAVETVTPEVAPVEDTLLPNTDKVAEAIQKARAQEKAKLYPQLEKLQDELSLLRKRDEERAAVEAERLQRRKAREAEREAEKKAQEEDEMSFKELLKAKDAEWEEKLSLERAERERLAATLEMEKQYQELSQFRNARLEQERENIVPELIDLISGNNQDEIEASIADLKARSQKIFESVAAVSQQTRKEMVGTRITVPASGPLDNNSDSYSLTPDSISNMSMADYAKNRAKLLGGTNNRGQGLFG